MGGLAIQGVYVRRALEAKGGGSSDMGPSLPGGKGTDHVSSLTDRRIIPDTCGRLEGDPFGRAAVFRRGGVAHFSVHPCGRTKKRPPDSTRGLRLLRQRFLPRPIPCASEGKGAPISIKRAAIGSYHSDRFWLLRSGVSSPGGACPAFFFLPLFFSMVALCTVGTVTIQSAQAVRVREEKSCLARGREPFQQAASAIRHAAIGNRRSSQASGAS
jgi:hypothetical protein